MTDPTTHASAAPTTPDSTPVEWHTADADDRWPGRWTRRFDLFDRARALENQIVWVSANQAGTFGALRLMAKADPLMRQVYLRHIKYRSYYRPTSTPWRKY